MPEATVTLTGFELKSGENENGPFVLTRFKSDEGKSYQTFDEELAEKLKSGLGSPVALAFEVQSRTFKGKTFTNNVITGLAESVAQSGGAVVVSGGGGSSRVSERLQAFEAGLQLVSIVAPESLNMGSVTAAAENILAWADGSQAVTGGDAADDDPTDIIPD